MGNQGKIANKQSGKIYVLLHIFFPSLIFEKNLTNRLSQPTYMYQSNGDIFC